MWTLVENGIVFTVREFHGEGECLGGTQRSEGYRRHKM